MFKKFFALAVLTSGIFNIAQTRAHDVSASSVKVIVGDTGALEVWQTTPHVTAGDIASKINVALDDTAGASDRATATSMAMGWHVVSDNGTCTLGKQAYRRIHHETELQMRYLFVCPDGARPTQVSLPWLTQAPSEHFIMLELTANGQRRTKIFERQKLSIAIPARAVR